MPAVLSRSRRWVGRCSINSANTLPITPPIATSTHVSTGHLATARATTNPHNNPVTAATGVSVKKARDSLIGVLMVSTAHALKLATPPHNPRIR